MRGREQGREEGGSWWDKRGQDREAREGRRRREKRESWRKGGREGEDFSCVVNRAVCVKITQ